MLRSGTRNHPFEGDNGLPLILTDVYYMIQQVHQSSLRHLKGIMAAGHASRLGNCPGKDRTAVRTKPILLPYQKG